MLHLYTHATGSQLHISATANIESNIINKGINGKIIIVKAIISISYYYQSSIWQSNEIDIHKQFIFVALMSLDDNHLHCVAKTRARAQPRFQRTRKHTLNLFPFGVLSLNGGAQKGWKAMQCCLTSGARRKSIAR